MGQKRSVGLLLGMLILLAFTLAGCAGGTGGVVIPAERTIYMAVVEPKGGALESDEPFPALALPEGGGYGLKPPDDTGRWEVETYRWAPGTIVVNQGDKVTLEIIGINGTEHPSTIEGYDLSFVVKRGEITRVSFTADKPGIFTILCSIHLPSMQATLVVLASR